MEIVQNYKAVSDPSVIATLSIIACAHYHKNTYYSPCSSCVKESVNNDKCNSGLVSWTFIVLTRNFLFLAECPARGLDMAFVLDSSNSVGRLNFSLTLEFVANISQAFTIGPQDTQVSVVSFNRFPNISFFFDTYSNISSLIGGIQQVPYLDTPRSGLTTYTAAALNILNLDVFTVEGGARGASFAIPRIAIIVTDGRSNINSSQTIPMAQALHEAGVTVFAVGVGKRAQTNRSRREFNGIASRPSFVSLLSEFNIMEFQSLQNNLRFEACSGKHSDYSYIEPVFKLICGPCIGKCLVNAQPCQPQLLVSGTDILNFYSTNLSIYYSCLYLY